MDSTELAPPASAAEVTQQARLVVSLDPAPQPHPAGPARVVAAPIATPLKETSDYPRLAFGAVAIGIGAQPLTIGRHADNGLQLNDGSVSGHHAVVKREGPIFLIRDLGSTSGTKVNGSPISESVLKEGDQIAFGDVRVQFVMR